MVPRITIANNVAHSFADWIASVCVYPFGKPVIGRSHQLLKQIINAVQSRNFRLLIYSGDRIATKQLLRRDQSSTMSGLRSIISS
jgi:hypothetical protein